MPDTESQDEADAKGWWSRIRTPAQPVLVQSIYATGPDGIKFDSWYGNRVLPAMRAQPGVHTVRRYACPSRSLYVTIAEMAHADGQLPAQLPEGMQPATVAGHESFLGTPLSTLRRLDADEHALDAPIVYLVFFQVPCERGEEFDNWYDQEHAPMVLRCAQWPLVRRFRIGPSVGTSWTHAAIHYLSDFKALVSPEREAARSTPWRGRLAAESWFKGDYQVLQRVYG